MARERFTDYFLNNKFHIIDVSFELPLVLIPVFGFSAISSPEISLNLADVKEGTYEFTRKVNRGSAEVGTITLSQGTQFVNSDLFDWFRLAVTGNVSRRNLLLVHFSQLAGAEFSIANFSDVALRIPGRAWLLWQCLPSRIKVASDFDAMDAGVSIAELDIQPENVFQFDTGIG